MNFNKHYQQEGRHAFLSASKYYWLNYDEEKIVNSYASYLAKQKGTQLHEFAAQAIELGVKLKGSRQTLNMYVNDAIGFKMTPEQILYYSDNCFGTADAISFRNGKLRIHDLKTGVTPARMEQLEIYAALFCLEYKIDPSSIEIELRIYQSDEIIVHTPAGEDIMSIMEKIIQFDMVINRIQREEG